MTSILSGEKAGGDGFTLVELLIALVLLSGLAVLLVQALFGARQSLQITQRINEDAPITAVRMAIQNLVEQARPVRRSTGKPDATSMLDGKLDMLTFISGYAPRGQYGGIYVTTIRLQATPRNSPMFDLVVEQAVYRPGADKRQKSVEAPPRRSRILKNIDGVVFRYIGKSTDQENSGWRDAWTSPSRLPESISLDVTFPTTDQRSWPTLIMQLPLAN